jgi:four helix bundle protein
MEELKMDQRLTKLDWADAMEDRFIEFASRVCEVVESLPDNRKGRHIAGQMIRSGTSPAPNYAEACAAESRADFVHKLGIVLKELRETREWLKLAIRSKCLPAKRLQPLIDECTELMNITGKLITTAKAVEPTKKRR